MARNIPNKASFPASVSTVSDTTWSLGCTVKVNCHHERKQAIIYLSLSTFVNDFDDEQVFTFIYHASNLVESKTFLKPAVTSLPQAELSKLARHSDPQLTTLCLAIKEPCRVRCPGSSGSLAARSGFETSFHQLVSLAKAIEVHIVFDLKWIHRNFKDQFLEVIKHPRGFVDYAVEHGDARYRFSDWTVFSPMNSVLPTEPPTYTAATNKRPRSTSTQSSESPPYKRLLQPVPLASTLSPVEPNNAVFVPHTELAALSGGDAPKLQKCVEDAVKEHLPRALNTILPEMLTQIFVATQSSPLSAPAPLASGVRAAPISQHISSLRSIISSSLIAHADDRLRAVLDDTIDHAVFLRSTADDEFFEAVHDHKTDVLAIKEDGIAELERSKDEVLAQFKDDVNDIVAEATEQTEQIYANVCAKLDELEERMKGHLLSDSQIRTLSEKQVRNQGKQGTNGGKAGDRAQRARSMPL